MAASARPTHDYTEADVLRWLNERTLRKAQGYEHAIRKLEVGPTHIHALVQGGAYAPYAVDIDFRRDLTNQFFVDMRCTCPVGHACKHAAVVLIAALARRGSQPAVNPAVLALGGVPRRQRSQAGCKTEGREQQVSRAPLRDPLVGDEPRVRAEHPEGALRGPQARRRHGRVEQSRARPGPAPAVRRRQ